MAVNGVRRIRSEKGSGFRSPVIRLSVRNVKDVLWIKVLVVYVSFSSSRRRVTLRMVDGGPTSIPGGVSSLPVP